MREAIELQGAEGFVGWQPGEPLQASDAVFFALVALGPHQLVQKGLMRQVGFGPFERQVLVVCHSDYAGWG